MKFLKIFSIITLILVATVSGAALKIVEMVRIEPSPATTISDPGLTSPDVPPPPAGRLKTDPLLGTTNVLLVGLDAFESVTRSDAIALAFFDLRGEAVGILSIPRDSRVQIPGRGWERINHAYVYGGVNLLRQALTNLTNVTINYHVVFSFENFPRMIDLVGGVDLYVERAMRYTDYSQKLFINIPQGQQHLDGRQSLHYVRFRHDPLGDIGRIQRQQRFMTAALEKVRTPLFIPQVPSLVREVVSSINTDLTPLEAIRLATFATTLKQGSIKFAMAPGRASYIGGLSYWTINPVEMSVMIPKLIAGEEDSEYEGEPETLPTDLDGEVVLALISQIGRIGILNGDGTRGLARDASQRFQRIGVDVSFTGDARHFGFESSNIVYPSEQYRQAAEALAQLCGITNMTLVRRDTSARVGMVSIILGRDKENILNRLREAEPRS